MEKNNFYTNANIGIVFKNPMASVSILENHESKVNWVEIDNPKWFWWYLGWIAISIGIITSWVPTIMLATWFSSVTGYKSGWLGLLTGEIAFIISFAIYTLHEHLPNRKRKLKKVEYVKN